MGDRQDGDNQQAQPGNFQQGQATDFGGPANFDDDAYGGKGPAFPSQSAFPTMEVHHSGDAARSLGITFAGRKWLLTLHQPIYRDMDNQPAQFIKLANVIVAILIVIGAFYRFIASFSGSIAVPYCDVQKFAEEFCVAGTDPSTCSIPIDPNGTAKGTEVSLNCEWVKQHTSLPSDGFELFIQACFVIYFGFVNLMEEINDRAVQGLMGQLTFMSTLHGRGLYLLFVSALLMSHSHSMLMVVSALVMTVAFGYLVLAVLCKYTGHGERLGVHAYQVQMNSDHGMQGGETQAAV